jgi:nucleoside-diphosphate-sugar epimerase
VPSVGLRPETIYGVGLEEGPSSGPTRAIKAAVLVRHFSIPFTGSHGFTYAEDAARLLIAAARSSTTEAVSLKLRSEESSVEDFIEELEQAVPEARGHITCEGDKLASGELLEEIQIEELLGETQVPPTPLGEGIRRTADHFRSLAQEQRLHDRDLRE